MNSNAYFKEEDGRYSPINIMAVEGVKCISCSHLEKPSLLENHAKQHFLPQYSTSFSSVPKPRKLNLRDLINEKDEDTDISVKSMLPDHVPQRQKAKKKALHVYSKNETIRNNSIASRNYLIQEKDLFSNQLPSNLYIERQYENARLKEGKLQLKQKIDLPIEKCSIKRKKLALYNSNFNKNNVFRDQMKCEKKTLKPSLEASWKHYKIESFHESEEKSNPEQIVFQSLKMKNWIKKPQKSFNISTLSSAKDEGTTKRSVFVDKKNSESKNVTEVGSQLGKKQFECPSCHGFYCSTCHSTIPPKYRPIPNKKPVKQLTQGLNLFSQNYSNQNCQECTNI